MEEFIESDICEKKRFFQFYKLEKVRKNKLNEEIVYPCFRYIFVSIFFIILTLKKSLPIFFFFWLVKIESDNFLIFLLEFKITRLMIDEYHGLQNEKSNFLIDFFLID